MTLTLYMNPVSTASRPVTLLVTEKNLPVELKVVDLMSGEHKGDAFSAINPAQMVPALTDGAFRMAESSAILKYLAAKFELPEYPADLQKRAKIDEAMDWFNTQFYRDFGYNLLYPQLFAHHKRPTDDCHENTIVWGKAKTQAALRVLDTHFLGANDYVANNAISIADYFGAGLMSAGELVRCTWDGFPNVQRWMGNMKRLGAWAPVHEAMMGFAASLKDKEFERV